MAPSALSQLCLQSETFNPSQNSLQQKILSRSDMRHQAKYQSRNLGTRGPDGDLVLGQEHEAGPQ